MSAITKPIMPAHGYLGKRMMTLDNLKECLTTLQHDMEQVKENHAAKLIPEQVAMQELIRYGVHIEYLQDLITQEGIE